MAANRERVVAIAKGWLGYNERDKSHRKIVDIYNAHNPLAQGYKVTYTDAWCATFVSAVMIEAGLTDIAPTECSCPRMIELYKKKGKWVESDSYTPKVGDIVMYDWQDSGIGDNVGTPDHVGIVTKVTNGVITVIEGNIDNAVGYRSLVVNGKFIRGYCTPDYESKDGKKVPDAIDQTIQNAIKDIGMDSPAYWEDVLRGKKTATAGSVKALMDKYHAAVVKKS